jgi:hypothetical protein
MMESNERRALLIGVEGYNESAGFRRLPVVRADVELLHKALVSSGCSAKASNEHRVTKTQLQDAIKAELQGAKAGETLLIYYSGHGVHYDGITYLVFSDGGIRNGLTGETHLPSELEHYLVPLPFFDGSIEKCQATNVIFLIDACREGLTISLTNPK